MYGHPQYEESHLALSALPAHVSLLGYCHEREGYIEIAGLSEMAADQDALSIVAPEEFVMLAQGRVGFILTPHLFSAWKLAGEVVHYRDGWMLITIKLHGIVYCFVSAYAPHQGTPNAVEVRKRYFDIGAELLRLAPKGSKRIILGDFNSRIGATTEDNAIGRKLLSTPTPDRSRVLIDFMTETELRHVDSHLSYFQRGTWLNGVNKLFYENDVSCATLRLQQKGGTNFGPLQ